MKKYVMVLAFVFPLLVLVCLPFYRKKHAVTGTASGITPSGAAFIEGKALHRSYKVWTNRVFITLTDNDQAFRALETLASSLPLSENVKSNAVQSCVRLIKAYARGDWEAFLSTRAPFSDYQINSEAMRALDLAAKYYNVENLPNTTAANALDIYHQIWGNLVKTNGLFSEISFVTDSITLLESSPNYLAQIGVPSFTDKTNRNYFKISPTSILDYRTKFPEQEPRKTQALRFFFFGKDREQCNYYMFIFALNEESGVWIPWRLTIGYAGAFDFKHRVTVF